MVAIERDLSALDGYNHSHAVMEEGRTSTFISDDLNELHHAE